LLPRITFKLNGQPVTRLSSTDIAGPEPILSADIDDAASDNSGDDEPSVPGDILLLIEKDDHLIR